MRTTIVALVILHVGDFREVLSDPDTHEEKDRSPSTRGAVLAGAGGRLN